MDCAAGAPLGQVGATTPPATFPPYCRIGEPAATAQANVVAIIGRSIVDQTRVSLAERARTNDDVMLVAWKARRKPKRAQKTEAEEEREERAAPAILGCQAHSSKADGDASSREHRSV
jgi:hypothetical protein